MGVQPEIWSFGAYYLDPRHLVFVIAVHTDAEKERLKSDAGFQARMRELLVTYNWPAEVRALIHFDIESQETVNREDDGNWWEHYK